MPHTDPHLIAYPHAGFTRIVIVPDVVSPEVRTPSLCDLQEAINVTCDMPLDGGLDPRFPHQTVGRIGWAEGPTVEAPTRYGVDMVLTGLRGRPDTCALHLPGDPRCCAGTLWDLARNFRCKGAMYVRRGIPADEPFAIGQEVEAFGFWWGKRGVLPMSRNHVLFQVPIFTFAHNDEAVIESPGLDMNGTLGSGATTPDGPQHAVDGDLTITALVQPDVWGGFGGTDRTIYSHGTPQGVAPVGYAFQVTPDGSLQFQARLDIDGVVQAPGDFTEFESSPTGFGDGERWWVRAAFNSSFGQVTFSTSQDGINYTTLSTSQAVGSASVTDSTQDPRVGALGDGTEPWEGSISYVSVADSDGTIADPDFRALDPGTTTFQDSEGNTWTLAGSAQIPECGAESVQFFCDSTGMPLCSASGGATVMATPGNSGDDFFSAPDDSSFDIDDDLWVAASVAPSSWSPGSDQTIAAHRNSSTEGWRLRINSGGGLRIDWGDGASGMIFTGEIPPVAVDGQRLAVGLWLDVDDGGGDRQAHWYYSTDDGQSWIQYELDTATGTSSVAPSTADATIGSDGAQAFTGNVYWVEVRDGNIAGPGTGALVYDVDFTNKTIGQTSFADGEGHTWTASGDAEIVEDPAVPVETGQLCN